MSSGRKVDATSWFREPGRGRYARHERERRFLVRPSVPTGLATRLIEDRYLEGTSLRLRRVTSDGRAVHKLTQKVRTSHDDPAEVLITNLYLSAEEHQRLAALPGHVIAKTRTVVATTTHEFVVDDFQGQLQGLRLAEVEVDDLAAPLDLPDWVGAEVTHDDRYSGGSLAALDPGGLDALLDPR
ncbi:MAG: hypothetical protein EPN99_02565 [Frankiales bacterium]|nr:MAG: hypothetical protein EPN99_02565 [Frankiales bacterium]